MINKNQLLTGVIAAIFVLLFFRLFQVQFVEHAHYDRLAEENAAKTVLEPAPRGVILDRFGKIIVENRPLFTVQILPHVLNNLEPAERQQILNRLGFFLGQPVKLQTTANEPIIVKNNIARETAIKLEEERTSLKGVVVSPVAVRHYPYGSLASHLLGYIGEIEQAELAALRDKGYRYKDLIGKAGVEKVYDQLLRGQDGGKKIEVNVHGTPLRILESLAPVPGNNVKLTIDLSLQRAVEQALGGREGAVVVLDPNDGKVLALASSPDYDPNLFIDPAERWKWSVLVQGQHPFVNRALAIYPPGSIFKVVTLAAALGQGLIKPNESFYCPGYYKLNDRIAKCWLSSGHGHLSALEGLVHSCDVVYYELGRRLGPDNLTDYARNFGLGAKTGIDLPQEKRGTVPTKAWKQAELKEPWYVGDSINYSIGQGFVQVTPLQMAVVYAAIASGQLYRPYVVEEVRDRDGELIYSGKAQIVGRVPYKPADLLLVRQALRNVVKRGTGQLAEVADLPVAGKTGTAQTPGKPHAWFVGYAPADKPSLVIAVFIAHGEAGDRVAAGVVKEILTWYRDNRLLKAPVALNR